MRIYYNSSTETVDVVDGTPPVDQSALVAQLQADLSAANSLITVLQGKIAAAQAALA